jgi:hypothetical protein
MRRTLLALLVAAVPALAGADDVSEEAQPGPAPASSEPAAEAAMIAALPPAIAPPTPAALAAAIPTAVAPAALRVRSHGTSRFGLALDTAVPEGLTIGLTFRPVPSVRLWAGPAWNYLSFGAHAGVALVPFHWAITPALSFEAGRFFRADLTRFVKEDSGAPSEVAPLLRNVSYDYAAAHVGLEIGSQRGFAVALRAGLAYVRVIARGRTAPSAEGPAGEAQVTFVDPRLNATLPSVKLGIQYAF